MRRYNNKKPQKKRFIVACIVIVIAIILSIIINISLRPIIFDMAQQYASYAVYDLINDAVSELIKETDFDYNRFAKLTYNDSGYVTSVGYDYAQANYLSLSCSKLLVNKLSKLKAAKISVPLGSTLPDLNTQGRGLKIKLKITQASVPDIHIVSTFEECGINQTRHEIRLIISIDAGLYIAPQKCDFNCTQEYILAQTIIVGEIPSGYVVVS